MVAFGDLKISINYNCLLFILYFKVKGYEGQRSSSRAKDECSYDVQKLKYCSQKKFLILPCFASNFMWLHSAKNWKFHYGSHINLQQLQHQILIYQLVPSAVLFGKYEHSWHFCFVLLVNEWQTILFSSYRVVGCWIDQIPCLKMLHIVYRIIYNLSFR